MHSLRPVRARVRRVPHLRDSFIVAKVGIRAKREPLSSTTTYRATGNPFQPTNRPTGYNPTRFAAYQGERS